MAIEKGEAQTRSSLAAQSDASPDEALVLLVRELAASQAEVRALRAQLEDTGQSATTAAKKTIGHSRPLPIALTVFDTLPDSAAIDVHCLAALRGRSVASTWRDAAKGLIPQPKKYGSSTRWNVGEVRRALAGAPQSSDQRVGRPRTTKRDSPSAQSTRSARVAAPIGPPLA